MEMVPYDFAEFVTQMFLWPADENDLSALLLVIGNCLRSSLGTTDKVCVFQGSLAYLVSMVV